MARSGSKPFGPADLDSVDRHILRLLRDDGRRPNADIARTIGVSEPTVRKRIDRMMQNDVLKVLAILDAEATGFPVDAIMGIRVKPGKIREVGTQLAAMDYVAYVGYVTGRYDIIIETMLRDKTHQLEFINDCLAPLDGIVSSETFNVLSTEKFNYMWEIPYDSEEPDVTR